MDSTPSSRDARLSRAQLRAVGRRCHRLPLFLAGYAWCKVRLDPVYPLALAELEGARQILDLGAGIGLLELLLAERPAVVRVRAVEWDERKVRAARAATADLSGVSVERGDLREADLGRPDAIALLDVLHYLSRERQGEVLKRCVAALAPGGLLLVRDLDPPQGRGSLSVGLERLAVALGLNRGAKVQPWPPREMASFLEGQGFAVSVRPAGRGLFSANALLVARKPS